VRDLRFYLNRKVWPNGKWVALFCKRTNIYRNCIDKIFDGLLFCLSIDVKTFKRRCKCVKFSVIFFHDIRNLQRKRFWIGSFFPHGCSRSLEETRQDIRVGCFI